MRKMLFIGAAIAFLGGNLPVQSAEDDPPPRAARSVHLGYPAPETTIFYNELTVEQSVPGSYFMACGFRHGYFGIQELGRGKKVVIFSVWDPTKGNDPNAVAEQRRVEVLHKADEVIARRFGGEGTGGQSFYDFDWQIGTPYRFLVRATVEEEKTAYAAHFYLPEEKKWKHLVTFRTQTGGDGLKGLYSFIEDFRRDTRSARETRRATFGNGWIRGEDGQWKALDQARFTASGASWEAKETIDAGVVGDRFYLQTGGDTTMSKPLRSMMERPQTDTEPPEIALAAANTESSESFYPHLVTAETKADPAALAALETPGDVFFRDDFETPESLERYFEIRGLKEGRVKLTTDPSLARFGNGAIQFTAVARNGNESGVGANGWFGPDGHDCVYYRRYIKFASDYDQGNLNHVGGGLAGVAGRNRYGGMGSAGIRPKGDDRFTSSFEPWRDWGRYPAPGYMFLYTYWMDMKRGRDGNYYGNMLGPDEEDRIALERDRWYCLEHMIRVNDIGQANGELAAWIDGQLYIHYRGFRWRSDADVKLKRFNFGVYVHRAEQDNTVWYDNVVLSTGYIGLKEGE